ncbi:site-2 protease family protein [Tropicibacter sp. S64]|uniref:site-2 protease family protein n=1 Tax=Tropicibacter sp. S64 TaxID=3415122 RepID=UPI003C7C6DD5
MFSNQSPLFTFRGPFGVPVEVGPSILLLLLIFVDFGGTSQTLTYDLMFFALVVLSIFLHEFGHAWGCIVQGVPVRRVVIYGGGGFCESVRSGTRREEELIVAMGPIVNLVLWAVASLLWPSIDNQSLQWVVWAVGWINGFLAILNLLPVLPLDGGKLLQLGLLRLMPRSTATRLAGTIGLVVSLLWLPAMLAAWYYLGFVLFFLPSIALHWRMAKGEIA